MKHWMTALPWKASYRGYFIPTYFARTLVTVNYSDTLSQENTTIVSLQSRASFLSGVFGCYFTFSTHKDRRGGGYALNSMGRSSKVGQL